MSLGTILQTIIAVIFIYLILSLITSEIQEAIASIFEFRAKRLKESIKQFWGEEQELVKDSAFINCLNRILSWLYSIISGEKLEKKTKKSLTELLYKKSSIRSLNQSSTSLLSLMGLSQERPIISGIIIVVITFIIICFSIFVKKSILWSIILLIISFVIIAIFNLYVLEKSLLAWRKDRQSKGPSYINPQIFSQAILEIIQDNLEKDNKFTNPEDTGVVDKIKKIEFSSPAVSKLIEIAESLELEKTNPNLSDFKTKLEKSFEEVQKRSSGVYKRNAKGLSFVLGLFIVMIANAEAFYIVANLSKDNNSFKDRVVNRLEEAKRTSESGFLSSSAEENNGLGENEEQVIRNILDGVATLPFGWNFEQELETQNLTELIKILDKKVENNDCFTSNSANNKNEECFMQFLADIEQNPHLESYFQLGKNSQNKGDTIAKKEFVDSLEQVENCLDSENQSENQKETKCLQNNKKYDFTQLKDYYSQNKEDTPDQELIKSLKPFENCLEFENPEAAKCLHNNNNKKYDFTKLKDYYSQNKIDTPDQELIKSLKPFENCLEGDDLNIGKCMQGYDFPTTYRHYRQQLKDYQLSQRIRNIQTSQTDYPKQVAAQIKKQGGWYKVIFGWLISAIAISMGAPFWFDLLGKVMNVRNAGKPLEKSKQTKQSDVVGK